MRHFRLLPLLLTAVFAIANPGPASAQAVSPSACADSEVPGSSLSAGRAEASVLCLINAVRASQGLGAVAENPLLDRAAAGHSADMVALGYFTHDSLDGTTFVQRIARAGYMCGARGWLVGENLGWGSGTRSTPRSVMEAWWDSPPHRANLLRGSFREVGIGIAFGTPSAEQPIGMTVSTDYGVRWRGKHHRPRRAHRGHRRHKSRL